MNRTWLKSYRKMTIILAVMFFLVCVLGTSGSFPVRNIGSYLGMFMCIYWTMAERKRILQPEQKRYLSLIGNLLILLYCLREIRGLYFDRSSPFSRYLWYLYYLTILAVPLLSFFTAWNTSGKEMKSQKENIFNMDYQDIYEAVERKLNKESALQNRWQEISGIAGGRYKDGSWKLLKVKN